MAKTPSTMVPLGTPAPDFALPDCVDGNVVRRDDFAAAPALLVMFICNHCPYVVHIRNGLVALTRQWAARGVAVVAISANDPEAYPADAPERMAEDKRRYDYPFPYLFDATQEVAVAYHAACTPDFFLYDRERRLAYRGQLDGARPGNGVAVTGADLGQAIDKVLDGLAPSPEQRPSMGCNIKWRARRSS
ncbi:MAG: thioredoxin family protein [Myxococcota bacterium]